MKGTVMRALATSVVLGLSLLLTSPVAAQVDGEPPEAASVETAAEERAAQFVGVTGPEAESVPGGALLISAYAVVWVLLFLFLFRMRGLQRQTAEELERLAAEVRTIEGG